MEKVGKKSLIEFQFTNSKFVPNDTAKGLFLFLISQTIVTLIYQVMYMVGFVQSIWSYVFTLLLDAAFIYCVYYITKIKKYDFMEAIKAKKAPSLVQVFLCLIIAIVCMFGFSAVTNLFLEVLYSAGYSSMAADVVIPNFWSYLVYVLFICVVPAIAEEVLFRGLICSGLKKISSVVAVFGSAFLFMIMHGSPDQTVHQFILGIVLALAFLITNNLWVPILIHFFNNFIAVTYSFIFQNISAASVGGNLSIFEGSTYLNQDVAGGVTPPVAAAEPVQIYLWQYALFALLSALIATCIIYLLLRALSAHAKDKVQLEEIKLKEEVVNYPRFYMEDGSIVSETEFSSGLNSEEMETKLSEKSDLDEEDYYVYKDPENKLNGSGKAMYFISVVWLVVDWISALVLGFTTMM